MSQNEPTRFEVEPPANAEQQAYSGGRVEQFHTDKSPQAFAERLLERINELDAHLQRIDRIVTRTDQALEALNAQYDELRQALDYVMQCVDAHQLHLQVKGEPNDSTQNNETQGSES